MTRRPTTSLREADAFLLSREWRDVDDGVEIVLWARAKDAPVRVRLPRQEVVMFVSRDAVTRAGRRAARALTTFDGRPVDAVYFRSQRALARERERLRDAGERTLESDVKPSERYLMERFVNGGIRVAGPAYERRGVVHFDSPRVTPADVRVALSVLALDIETDGANCIRCCIQPRSGRYGLDRQNGRASVVRSTADYGNMAYFSKTICRSMASVEGDAEPLVIAVALAC